MRRAERRWMLGERRRRTINRESIFWLLALVVTCVERRERGRLVNSQRKERERTGWSSMMFTRRYTYRPTFRVTVFDVFEPKAALSPVAVHLKGCRKVYVIYNQKLQ